MRSLRLQCQAAGATAALHGINNCHRSSILDAQYAAYDELFEWAATRAER